MAQENSNLPKNNNLSSIPTDFEFKIFAFDESNQVHLMNDKSTLAIPHRIEEIYGENDSLYISTSDGLFVDSKLHNDLVFVSGDVKVYHGYVKKGTRSYALETKEKKFNYNGCDLLVYDGKGYEIFKFTKEIGDKPDLFKMEKIASKVIQINSLARNKKYIVIANNYGVKIGRKLFKTENPAKLISTNGNVIIYADNMGKLYRIDDKGVKLGFRGCRGAILGMAMTNDHVVCTSLDKFTRLFDLNSRKLLVEIYNAQNLLGCCMVRQVSKEDSDLLWNQLPIISSQKDSDGKVIKKLKS
jgi:hypothetical protein